MEVWRDTWRFGGILGGGLELYLEVWKEIRRSEDLVVWRDIWRSGGIFWRPGRIFRDLEGYLGCLKGYFEVWRYIGRSGGIFGGLN